MIIRPRKRWSVMLILQGSLFFKLWQPLLGLFVFSSLIYSYHRFFDTYDIRLNASVFTLLGIALAIFMGFCNNAAYDRFWEARKLWGHYLVVSRSFARTLLSASSQNPAFYHSVQQEAILLEIAFGYALKHQLRGSNGDFDLKRLLPEKVYTVLSNQPFIAMNIQQQLGMWLQKQYSAGHLDSWQWKALDENLNELNSIQAGCERISNTPIPFSYFVLLERTVYWYCFLLPLGLVNAIGWVTPIMVTFVGYTFMALTAIVDEISDPFGEAENDLALTQICNTNEQQLRQLAALPRADYQVEVAPRYVVR